MAPNLFCDNLRLNLRRARIGEIFYIFVFFLLFKTGQKKKPKNIIPRPKSRIHEKNERKKKSNLESRNATEKIETI